MEAKPPPITHCPHCGAANPPTEDRCQSCSKGLVLFIGPARALPRKYGLGSIMVLVAVVAIGLGIQRFAPGLGIAFLVLVMPAMLRTSVVVSQRIEDTRPMTMEEKSLAFLGSIGLMIAVIVAAYLTFFATCIPVGFLMCGIGMFDARYSIVALHVVSGLAGLWVGFLLLKKFWRYRE